MERIMRLTMLCVVVSWGMLACVATQPKPPQLSASSYQIKVRVEPSQDIWLTPPESTQPRNYHGFGVISIEVTDAQGDLVNDVPVTFRLPSDWVSYASLSQQQTVTKDGRARVVFEPATSGLIHITIQVDDDDTREATFLVHAPALGCGGRPDGGMPEPRWAYY